MNHKFSTSLLVVLCALSVEALAADTLTIEPYSVFTPDEPDEVRLISEDEGGGYLLHGRTRSRSPGQWIARWDSNFAPQWRKPIDFPYPSTFTDAVIRSGTGYVLATRNEVADRKDLAKLYPNESPYRISGRAFRSAVELITAFDADVAQRSQAKVDGLGESKVDCVLAVNGGYVLSGWKEIKVSGSTAYRTIPWLARITNNGATAWERTFANDGTFDLSDAWRPDNRSCSRRLLQTDRMLVAVFNAQLLVRPPANGAPGPKAPFPRLEHRIHSLVVLINDNGKEITRRLSKAVALDSFLLKTRTGYVLIENYAPDFPDSIRYIQDADAAIEQMLAWESSHPAGIRYTDLDRNLTTLREVESPAPLLEHRLRAVTPGIKGYLLAGCGLESGVAVAHLDEEGHLGAATRANPRSIVSCSTPGMVAAPTHGGSVLLVDNLDSFTGKKTTYTLYIVRQRK